jgi:hypothetical protein
MFVDMQNLTYTRDNNSNVVQHAGATAKCWLVRRLVYRPGIILRDTEGGVCGVQPRINPLVSFASQYPIHA